MHFDDRLSTVLRHSATSGTLARIQYRQLIDILAQAPSGLVTDLTEAGYARLDSLGATIRDTDQAELIRQSLVRLTNPRLLALLAEAGPQVASAALAKTRLSEAAWLDLIPALPVHARGILRHRRDLPPRVNDMLERLGIGDRALPPIAAASAATETLAPSAERSAGEALEPPAPQQTEERPGHMANAEVQARTLGAGRVPSNEAEVEELVLTQLLGDEPPAAPPFPAHRPEADQGPPVSTFAPPHDPAPCGSTRAATQAPSTIPTSLREWARLRASGPLTPPPPPPLAPDGPGDPGIGAIVRRIEEFRRSRQKPQPTEPQGDSPRLPLGDAISEATQGPTTLDFATDALGRITWADGPFASAVTGFLLPLHESEQETIATAVRHGQPIRGARIQLSGPAAISGIWQVDAAACFDQGTGRFTGHSGRLRRPHPSVRDTANASASAEADRMRQVLHELRTPANAIQVAAEIIQQQLYGPAPHEYRALAASIAGDCAHILAGFEELDRLVKLETGALSLDPGLCNFALVTHRTIQRLGSWTGPRNSGFRPSPDLADAQLPIALEHDEAERLVWRLLAALAGASASEERLALHWAENGSDLRICLQLPKTLAEREGDALFAIGDIGRGQALTAGVFGVGFTLRLASAEARSAGGGLQRIANELVLTLPLARVKDARPDMANLAS
ncbi:sensor histidine kinase [Novosphingobium decolorationis]|uniref:histidine kinase n=1 Tax=Novosphingobium decolorationis TaxID=2698673 RepID=A0ABX8EC82_9SPHN|nr:sensor histidine kinase [Novosphingobium decolorationis]QVM85745.1 sensor histidine kinase [Novosphingobium decolorationis]